MKDFANWCPTCGKWKEVCSHGKKLEGATDLLGNALKVGTVILYPNRRGSSLWMCYAIIRDYIPETTELKAHLSVYAHSEDRKETLVSSTIYCMDRIVRVHPEEYNDKIKWMVKEFWTNRYKTEGSKCT